MHMKLVYCNVLGVIGKRKVVVVVGLYSLLYTMHDNDDN